METYFHLFRSAHFTELIKTSSSETKAFILGIYSAIYIYKMVLLRQKKAGQTHGAPYRGY